MLYMQIKQYEAEKGDVAVNGRQLIQPLNQASQDAPELAAMPNLLLNLSQHETVPEFCRPKKVRRRCARH